VCGSRFSPWATSRQDSMRASVVMTNFSPAEVDGAGNRATDTSLYPRPRTTASERRSRCPCHQPGASGLPSSARRAWVAPRLTTQAYCLSRTRAIGRTTHRDPPRCKPTCGRSSRDGPQGHARTRSGQPARLTISASRQHGPDVTLPPTCTGSEDVFPLRKQAACRQSPGLADAAEPPILPQLESRPQRVGLSDCAADVDEHAD
jgi:hypothetical protein